MTIVKTAINRRSFLKVSAAGGTGLLIGFNWLASCSTKPQQSIPKEWFDINAYIKIADNGLVTIYSPNPEIGQNVKTAMPLIIAEELDVDWTNVMVEQADLNTVKYSRQLAGGSQSIRHGWPSLRRAGATARRLLLEVAAKRWQTDINQLSVSNGVIKHSETGKELHYGELVVEAAAIPVPEDVELKSPEKFELIGKGIKNVDGQKIVTGNPLFGLDYNEEGQVIAMIIHPPSFGMTLKSFDASEAEKLPGIHKVFTIDTSLEESDWSATNAFNKLIAVTGSSTWQVMKAKKAVIAEWESTELENDQDHQQLLLEAIEKKEGHVQRQDGNPEDIIKRGDRVIERTYTAPFIAHNPMEPMNFFANVTTEKADLIGPIQTPENLRKLASRFLNLPEEKVNVQMTRMGGGFGRRLYGHFGLEAALISQQLQAPVKLIYSREDDMTQGTYRPAYRVKYTATLDQDNNLSSLQCKAAGIPGSPLFANRFPAGTIDHYKAESLNLGTNISTGAWRAPRSNFMAGAEQSFLDEVAELAGKDPIDFRLNLFDRAINNPVGERNDYDPERYAGVIKLVREKSNWDTPIDGVYRGASAYYCHNSYVAQVVDLVMENDKPVIQKVWCAVDCGIVINNEGAVNQVEGAIIDGIGHAMYAQMNFDNGAPQQNNFHQYRLIRNMEAPREIEVFFVESEIDPTGLGEPGLPPIIGALASALYKATGQRFYDQPFGPKI
ncbi:xanthine dehydrogenase family protein molybdopterin-binding subunit [Marinoscillum sp. MHG1-6]|uniref:xanthine dehydrogenase family protein molybdopterin-binding subunit n=1 Tax=Marinoscillum sp. MHG1-6 TaxID=2959627 RepID=UPI002158062C|nr:molybdopterin cofactor-binding domain-containing protein [Marinoscillum sp. MHG1-6]